MPERRIRTRSKAATDRTKPRIEGEDHQRQLHKRAGEEKSATNGVTANILDDGIVITGQIAETVPVAQYANVVLLSGLQWKMPRVAIEALVNVNWGDLDEEGFSTFDTADMSADEREVYEYVRGCMRATAKLIEHGVAEDRETVERSIRMHNEREEAREKAEAKRREQEAKDGKQDDKAAVKPRATRTRQRARTRSR